ncbi:MAG: DNA repair protein RecN [Pseudomonadota bacterium]
MLQRLTIKDFVLADRLELEFAQGFGVLTGETGAGKSMLIDALSFVLGDRADVSLIRSGCERSDISAEFDLVDAPDASAWLQEQDLAPDDSSDNLLLRRVIERNGRSRAYLNGVPIPLQQLRAIAEFLLDIHGQHAHQSLLRSDAQRVLFDTHAGNNALLAEVKSAWQRWQSATSAWLAASGDQAAVSAEREQLGWQINELAALNFSADTWQSLNAEHKRLAHAASLVEGTQFALSLLAEGDAACALQLDRAAHKLSALSEYDPALSDVTQLIQSAQAELGEAVSALHRYADHLEADPARLNEVEQAIDAVLNCARKFRTTPEALPALLERWQQRLEQLSAASDLTQLEAEAKTLGNTYQQLAQRLSAARATAAVALGSAVTEAMQQLALNGGRFEIALCPLAQNAQGEVGSAYGLEQIEFRIAGLAGNEARPLAKVASGGELSRISLAIQVVTSQAACVPTLIFDEVDVGIGGGVAEVVGRLLRQLGTTRQVLCVTHLAQVAARANWQWYVSKAAENAAGEAGETGETDDTPSASKTSLRSRVCTLDQAGRIEEIARMLGGVEITELTRQHAKEMLGVV